MRTVFAAISIFILLPSISFASADRVALVVGISSYKFVPELKNPVNDLKVMRETLQRLGFEVVSSIDASKEEFEKKIEEFRAKMRNSEVALFYYAGHGLQVNGKNYLIPRDASLPDLASIQKQSIEFDRIISLMEQMSRTNLVFLDACRNNPLSRNLSRALGDGSARSVIGTGLASVNVGKGTLVTYSTQPGNVAADGAGVNSPFTSALAKWMNEPGLEVRQMLSRVRKDVLAATYGQQVPWDHSSMTGDFYFNSNGGNSKGATSSDNDDAMEMWRFISQNDDLEMYETFVKSYPSSKYTPFAVAKIASLRSMAKPLPNPERIPVKIEENREAINGVAKAYILGDGLYKFANFNSGVVIDRFDSQLEQAEGSAVAVHFEVTLVGGLAGDLTQASIQIVDGKGTLIIENRNGKFVVTKLKSLKTS